MKLPNSLFETAHTLMAVSRCDVTLRAIEQWIKQTLPFSTGWDRTDVLLVNIPRSSCREPSLAFLSHDGQTLFINVRHENGKQERHVSLADPKSLDQITDFLRSVV